MARVVRWPYMQRLMVLGIRAIVPRHRIGIAVVALNGEGQVLMLKHVFHPYAPWGLPGGWLDRGESPRRGALRELREETGLSARLGQVLHISRQPDPDAVNIAFLACELEGEMQLSSEIIDARWFAADALPEPLFVFTRDAIEAAVAAELQAAHIEHYSAKIE